MTASILKRDPNTQTVQRERGREGDRQRQRDRHRETHRERQRHTERHRRGQRDTDGDRETDRQTDRDNFNETIQHVCTFFGVSPFLKAKKPKHKTTVKR